MDNKRALIISPHPDDLEIGMGGTAAKMAEKGVDIASLVVTDGRRSTSEAGFSEDKVAEIRKNEVREAAGILGLDVLIMFELADAEGDNAAIFKEELGGVLVRLKPAEIYIPHLETEAKMKEFAEDLGLGVEELDMLLWSMRRGYIPK